MTTESSAKLIGRLKRKHRVTIREIKARTGITLIRIRWVLEHGVENHHVLRDWIQAITGTDPGSVENMNVSYYKTKRFSR